MISKKTYIPAKPRNKKLIGGMMVASGGTSSLGMQHSHANKDVIDQLTQLNIDVLSYLSLYQTGVEMKPLLDEYGQPVLDVNGDPVMVPVERPVLDEFGQPVLDINGDPVTEQIPIYAIRSTASFFSEKEVSAYGLDEEEGGGGGYDMLQSWVDYTEEKSNWVVSAALSKGLLDRIVALEDGGGAGGSNVAWGALSSGYRELTVEGTTYSVAMSTHTHTRSQISDFAHSHAISDITGLQAALDGKSSTSHSHSWGSITGKPSTFTPSAHSHVISDVTGLQSALDGFVTLATAQTITGAKTFSAALTASVKVTTPIIDLGNGWTIEAGTSKIEVKQSGTVRARFESTGFVSTGEITAYS